MIRSVLVFSLALAAFSARPARAETMPELATLLSLFSASATDPGALRLNWTLDQQSPAIIKFKLYRGYEELGNFSILAEIPFHAEAGAAEYLYQDTLAVPGVTYYYKLSAVGQVHESVFPVVISAGIPFSERSAGQDPDAPLLILPGDRITLYVRTGGALRLERVAPDPVLLIEDTLRAGLYEFDGKGEAQTLRLSTPDGFRQTIDWPLK